MVPAVSLGTVQAFQDTLTLLIGDVVRAAVVVVSVWWSKPSVLLYCMDDDDILPRKDLRSRVWQGPTAPYSLAVLYSTCILLWELSWPGCLVSLGCATAYTDRNTGGRLS